MFTGIFTLAIVAALIFLACIKPKCPNCKYKFNREYYTPGDPENVFYECPNCDK